MKGMVKDKPSKNTKWNLKNSSVQNNRINKNKISPGEH